jgi:hypothetical protein
MQGAVVNRVGGVRRNRETQKCSPTLFGAVGVICRFVDAVVERRERGRRHPAVWWRDRPPPAQVVPSAQHTLSLTENACHRGLGRRRFAQRDGGRVRVGCRSRHNNL